MKKLFLILLFLPLMMVTSCKDNTGSGISADSKDALLDKEIAASVAQFPMQVDDATTLVLLSRDGNVVTYDYALDESKMNFDEFIANQESFKAQLRNNIVVVCTPSSDFHTFMTLLRDTDKELRYRYKGKPSGRSVTIEFSNNEIKELIKDE